VQELEEAEKLAHQVDLCFLIDGTGSMGDWITITKEKVEEIAKGIVEIYPDAAFRFGCVIYRDFDLKENNYQTHDFHENVGKLVSFLGSVEAQGGRDIPEDVNGGLQEVLKLEWANSTKCLIHFADSPCHGKRFHNFQDEHPNGGPNDIDYEKIFTELKSLGVGYYFMKIKKDTHKMVEEFQKIWNEAGVYQSNAGKLPEFTVKTLKEAESKDFVLVMKESIVESVKKNATFGVASMRKSVHMEMSLTGSVFVKRDFKVDDIIKESQRSEEFSTNGQDYSL